MKREHKYIVIKISDADKYLSDKQKEALTEINSTLQRGIRSQGKKVHSYCCIRDDYPMYESVWSQLSEWVDSKTLNQ